MHEGAFYTAELFVNLCLFVSLCEMLFLSPQSNPTRSACVLKIITLKKNPLAVRPFRGVNIKFITKYGSDCKLSFQLGVGARIEE
jgi:hypothetical protein